MKSLHFRKKAEASHNRYDPDKEQRKRFKSIKVKNSKLKSKKKKLLKIALLITLLVCTA